MRKRKTASLSLSTGPTGPTGVIGSTSVVTSSSAQATSGSAAGTTFGPVTATCPTGTKLLGGGATITQGGTARGAIYQSSPTPTTGQPTGWQASGVVTTSGTGAVSIVAYAVCGS
jgi:hypothetical protein